MPNDRFEIHPKFVSDEPEPISVPDFGAELRKQNESAKLLAGAHGILASGVLPEVKLALSEKDHKPNDVVEKEVIGFGKLEMHYDAHGQLASIHMDSGHGRTEDTTFRDGHVATDRVKDKDWDASYTFDSQGHVKTEIQGGVANSTFFYELAPDGTVQRSMKDFGDGSAAELENTPGHHVLKDYRPDSVGTLRYDDQLHFQSGEIRTHDELFGIRKRRDGQPVVVPESEA